MADPTTSLFLYDRSLKVAPGGVHSPVRSGKSVGGEPLFFRFAEGAYLESVEGKRYIDFCQSFGPNILGHRDPDVASEVEKIISRVWTLGTCEPYSLELAEWIQAKVPWAEKLRFVCSGTEAVMSAIRLARAATGRSKILKFEGCYHGHVDSMLVKAGSGLAGDVASDSAGVPREIAETTLICPLDDESAVENVFDRSGSEIAAVIIEPLPANFGLLIQRDEFLRKVVDIGRRHGALVIFDEVISGFRVAIGGMAERLGVH
jgi:glutamate-1-semialdehyde 2,1-aminomutase